MTRLLIGMISAYQTIGRFFLPPSCRHMPSCSVYAKEAIERHGAGAGAWLAIKRILRCHPFSPGGYDPVP